MTGQSHLMRRSGRAIALVLLALSAGCGDGILGSRKGDAIPRETFLATMVELRLTAYADNNTGVLPEGAQEAVLTRNGITAEDLVSFIEVHGRDIPFMDSVWAEVDGHVRAGLEARVVENTPTAP